MFFTEKEIGQMVPSRNEPYVFGYGHGENYLRLENVLGLRKRFSDIFGVDLDSPDYEDAWIDVFAELCKRVAQDGTEIGFCPGLYCHLVANTGDPKEDKEVYLSFPDRREQEMVFNQLASQDAEIRTKIVPYNDYD